MADNPLFPVFVKMHEVPTLIVGGGNVGLEKLSAVLKNSPEADVTLVADIILPEVYLLAAQHNTVNLVNRKFEESDLDDKKIVICATDNPSLHKDIKQIANSLNILVNVADTPDLCDFYLGSVVTRGDLKVGISTNGKSPTLAKRIREFLEDLLPDNTQQIIDKLHSYRNTIVGGFQEKVDKLNQITDVLVSKK